MSGEKKVGHLVLTRERLPVGARSHNTYDLVTGTGALQYSWWSLINDNRSELPFDADESAYVDWEVTIQHLDIEEDIAVGEPFVLNHQRLIDGIWALVCGSEEKSEQWRAMWLKYLLEPDFVDSDIDAAIADTLLQSVVIGDVIY